MVLRPENLQWEAQDMVDPFIFLSLVATTLWGPSAGTRVRGEGQGGRAGKPGYSCHIALVLTELSRWSKKCFVEDFGRHFWDHSSWETHTYMYTRTHTQDLSSVVPLMLGGLLQQVLFNILLRPLVPSSQSRGGHGKMGAEQDFTTS